MRTLTITNLAGDVITEVPDFDVGEPVRVLPDPIGSNVADAGDGWEFTGPTRHPSTAVIRHSLQNATVHVDRTRLLPR